MAPAGAHLSVPFRLLSMFYQWERNNGCGVIMDGSGFTLSRVSDVRRGEKGGKFFRGIARALRILFFVFFFRKVGSRFFIRSHIRCFNFKYFVRVIIGLSNIISYWNYR